jgi:nitroimidazol reductase NimA-like FMN-containing flavoprotein (pyridoxamine 5'-phosphate oxidase superfamily)
MVTSPDDILAIIKNQQICRIALNDDPWPYIVPVNFGYDYQDGRWTIWFHGARSGKKMRLLRRNPAVSVEIDGGYRLLPAADACDYSCAYASIIAGGRATIVQDRHEIAAGMDRIMRQAVPDKTFSYRDDMMKAVCVVRVNCETLTCRRHAAG